MESYCNDKIDIAIFEIFKKKFNISKGYFVDIGANDGITGSNTYLLEQNGWRGLLVEPNENLKAQLEKIRTNKIIYCAIADNDDGHITFNIVEGPENLHGLSRIESSERFLSHIKENGGKVVSKIVPTKKLTTLLNQNSAPAQIDFLSIDVEGHELTVLKTLDFLKFQPLIIICEDNSKGKNREVENYLKAKNYALVKRIGVNEIYTPNKFIYKFSLDLPAMYIKYWRWHVKRMLLSAIGAQDKNPLV